MPTREILFYPDPRLAEKAREIGEVTQEIRDLAADMLETMYENRGVGLAAPQVGACCRLIVMDVSGPEERTEPEILVNPRILSKEGSITDEEGCLSVRNFRAKVARAERVVVEAQDLDGNPVRIETDGLRAVCLQHEIDHLEGVLFVDYISRLKRAFFEKKAASWNKTKKSAE